MDPTSVIASASNPCFKRARLVAAGKDDTTLLLEGERLIEDALRQQLEFELLLVSDARVELENRWTAAGADVRRAAAHLMDRVGALKTSPGCLALVRRPAPLSIVELRERAGPRALLLVVAGIADPGNLGAVVRSAEASGCDGLIVVRGGASPWNERALRGSMGSLLRLPVAEVADQEELRLELAAAGFNQVSAATRGGARPETFDWSGPVALWIGSETGGEGLPRVLVPVTIPMAGEVESLNVSVAAALLLFAAANARRAGSVRP